MLMLMTLIATFSVFVFLVCHSTYLPISNNFCFTFYDWWAFIVLIWSHSLVQKLLLWVVWKVLLIFCFQCFSQSAKTLQCCYKLKPHIIIACQHALLCHIPTLHKNHVFHSLFFAHFVTKGHALKAGAAFYWRK